MDIQTFFRTLSQENLGIVDEFYAPQVDFVDPINALKGRETLKAYYERMYKHLTSIRFEFGEVITQGANVFATWTMKFAAPGLNGGHPIRVEGSTHLRYDAPSGKVVYHRDYFDMGAFAYEHLPVLGWTVHFIRRRMGMPNV